MEAGIIIGWILYIYFDTINIPHYLKKLLGLRRVKPFDCEWCLSFWTSVITIQLLKGFAFDWNILYITALSTITSYTIIKLLRT